ncbi:MAG: hypothetical protein EA357_10080 [Micavibrio sp.]|nr:MAG: hypothetical protein EA357_10080 [Micavibrio sp.]
MTEGHTDQHTEKQITEHILSLILYALAEADRHKMKTVVSVLDDALLKLIAEHEKRHGTERTWEKCTELYGNILQSLDDNRNIRDIPTLSGFKESKE